MDGGLGLDARRRVGSPGSHGASARHQGLGDDADKWLISEPDFVMTLSIKQMLGSAIFKDNLPALKNMITADESVKTLLETAGLDPFKDIDSILLSGSGNSAKDAKGLLVIKGRFDPDKVHAAVKKAAQGKGGNIELVKEGDKQLVAIKMQDQTFYAGFASKSVIVLTLSKESTLDAIKNGGTKTAKIGTEMKTALNKFTGKESLTFAMVVNDELKKRLETVQPPQIGKAAAKLQTLTASLTITDEVDFNVTGNTTEAKAAKQLSGGLSLLKAAAGGFTEDLPPIVGKVVDEIKIGAEKDSVVISLKLTKAMIEEARKQGGGK